MGSLYQRKLSTAKSNVDHCRFYRQLLFFLHIVECPAGTHYSTSLQTCLQCPKGHYQPLEGQPECLQCPDETTTEQIGAKYVEECLGI